MAKVKVKITGEDFVVFQANNKQCTVGDVVEVNEAFYERHKAHLELPSAAKPAPKPAAKPKKVEDDSDES
jgi:hypothetical protein